MSNYRSSPEDVEIVRKHYGTMGSKRVSRMLGCAPETVRRIAHDHGIKALNKDDVFGLTHREQVALRMFAAGNTGPEIAEILGMPSITAANNTLYRARQKIGGSTGAAMVLIAERAGLLQGVEP
jgi:DNA-binding CsgD family transcriptional regulator